MIVPERRFDDLEYGDGDGGDGDGGDGDGGDGAANLSPVSRVRTTIHQVESRCNQMTHDLGNVSRTVLGRTMGQNQVILRHQ